MRDVLRLGAHQLLATRVGRHAAVATLVDLAKDVCGPRPSGFVNAVLRRVATRDLEAWIDIVVPDRSQDPSGDPAVRYSHPRWIVDAYRAALGETARSGTRLTEAAAPRPRRPSPPATSGRRSCSRSGPPTSRTWPSRYRRASAPAGRRTASGWPLATRRPWSPAARRPGRMRPASWRRSR